MPRKHTRRNNISEHMPSESEGSLFGWEEEATLLSDLMEEEWVTWIQVSSPPILKLTIIQIASIGRPAIWCTRGELKGPIFEWKQTSQERNRRHSCSGSQSCQGYLQDTRSTCRYSLRARSSSIQQSLHRNRSNNVYRTDRISKSLSNYKGNFIYICAFFHSRHQWRKILTFYLSGSR